MNIKVKYDDERITNVRRHLDWLEGNNLLREINQGDIQKDSLTRLRSKFPKNRGNMSKTNEFGQKLSKGWDIETTIHAAAGGGKFRIFHHLADKGNQRAITVLSSLDKGSRAYNWRPPRTFKFIGKYSAQKRSRGRFGRTRGFVTFSEKKTYHRPARAGANYMAATAAYIENTLLPRLRARIVRKAKYEWDRATGGPINHAAVTRYVNQQLGR